MKKKLLSALLALCLTFGSAAALPQSAVADISGITVSAEKEGVDGDWKYWVNDEGKTYITSYTGNKTEITIPAKVGGRKVNSVGGDVLRENKTVTSVVFSDGIEEIQNYVCFDCTKLKKVTLPSSLKHIDTASFCNCPELAQINIPKSVTYIGNHVLNGTKYLENLKKKDPMVIINGFLISCEGCKGNITIPGTVKNISGWIFYGNKDITSVTISNGVKSIGANAFTNCSNLTKVSIPASVESFGSECFGNCAKLKTLTFANGIKTIDGYDAFSDCTALESLNFPDSLEVIGSSVFSGCTGLKKISFGKNLQYIGDLAFAGCISLKSIVLPSSTKSLDSAFYCCDGLTSVTLNEGLEVIGAGAFCNCSSLKSILIPKSVTQIGDSDSVLPAFGSYNRPTGPDFSAYIENFVCYKGTAGEKYAKQYGMKSYVIERYSGSGRFETAAAISKGAYSKTADTVVLASGRNFPDALAGVPLASKYNAPILLTEKESLPAETLTEIKRLKAKKVIILGGKGAVSEKVVSALKSGGIAASNITRISGSDRFETATKVAQQLQSKTKTKPTEVFFVCSTKYADALSVSPIAAKLNAPIIYLAKEGTINASTKAYLKSVKGSVTNAYVIGGTGVISDKMAQQAAKELGLPTSAVTRLKGNDRYDTCVAVNNKFAYTLTNKALCVATGEDYPDALAGGVFAALKSTPLFLVKNSLSVFQTSFISGKRPDTLFVFGGSKSVPADIITKIADLTS